MGGRLNKFVTEIKKFPLLQEFLNFEEYAMINERTILAYALQSNGSTIQGQNEIAKLIPVVKAHAMQPFQVLQFILQSLRNNPPETGIPKSFYANFERPVLTEISLKQGKTYPKSARRALALATSGPVSTGALPDVVEFVAEALGFKLKEVPS